MAAFAWLCPNLSAGLVRVRGQGVDVPETDTGLWSAAGLDVRVQHTFGARWFAEFAAGAAFNPRPHQVWLDGANVWTSGRFLLSGGLLAGYAWGPVARPQ